jgi:poly(A) polymerase
MWEKFDEGTMGIVVRHIKRFVFEFTLLDTAYVLWNSSALPDYVFDEGERQPKLAQKRPKTTKVCSKSSQPLTYC